MAAVIKQVVVRRGVRGLFTGVVPLLGKTATFNVAQLGTYGIFDIILGTVCRAFSAPTPQKREKKKKLQPTAHCPCAVVS